LAKNEQKGALKPLKFLFIQAGVHLFGEKRAKRCPEAIEIPIYTG